MTETFGGRGAVRIKSSGAAVAQSVPYSLRVTYPQTGRLGHIDASVDLDPQDAMPPFMNNEILTLTLEDGREFDFYVQAVEPLSGRVRVIAKGGGLRG